MQLDFNSYVTTTTLKICIVDCAVHGDVPTWDGILYLDASKEWEGASPWEVC
jgi:hypothetical protein